MRKFSIVAVLFCSILCGSSRSSAQGGIGNMPRQDLVMLSAVTRDSIMQELVSRIKDLGRFVQGGMLDSAATLLAYNGQPIKDGKWARGFNMNDSSERVKVRSVVENLRKVFAQNQDMRAEYYACFKDKDNPAGQKHFLQMVDYKTKRKTSWVFFPVGDKLLFGQLS